MWIAQALALGLSLLQVAVMLVPPLNWTHWMIRFGALEGSLLAVVTGGIALALALALALASRSGAEPWVAGPWVAGAALLCVLGGLLPGLLAAPVYLREGQRFSLAEWLGAGSGAAAPVVERDLALLPGLSADLWRAPGPGPHPFVVVVHGGSWRSGDKGDVADVSARLAAAGISVVDVQYRLAGGATPAGGRPIRFPAAIQDVQCWLVALRTHAAALGLDPERGALLGRSAGGQIALLAAYADPAALAALSPPDGPAACGVSGAPVRLRAVVSIYGPTDLAWAHANPYVPDVVDGTDALEVYLGGTPAQAPEAYRLATPMQHLGHPVPPTLLVHGTGERCVRPENARRLAEALRAAGQQVRLLEIPMADHGFDVRPGGIGEQLARGVILDFLRERLGVG